MYDYELEKARTLRRLDWMINLMKFFAAITVIMVLLTTIVQHIEISPKGLTCPEMSHSANWIYTRDFETTGKAYLNGEQVKCEVEKSGETLDVPLRTIQILQSYEGLDAPVFDHYDLVIQPWPPFLFKEEGQIGSEVYPSWHYSGKNNAPFMKWGDAEGNTYLYLPSGHIALLDN